jgi:rSAM/selenodomain-associated transferase 1
MRRMLREYTRAVFPTIPPHPKRLLVFARLPELGRVKTRLAAEIGDAEALAVYESMLRDTLTSVGASRDDLEIEVMWAPTEAANGQSLRNAFGDYALSMQAGETLGDRLAIAFSERFFFHRTQTIVAIGVDDPTLPRELIDHAFELLESCDWVFGPAVDGGYYLVGCRGAAFDSDAFAGIEWGTSTVLQATMTKIRGWQRNVAVLPERRDIDTVEDLRWYQSERREGN